MNILILGSGGREHALAWAVLQNPKCDKLIVAPGNAGIAQIAECASLDIENGGAVVNFAEAGQCNVDAFRSFYHLMLDRGVYLAPSAFEAGFVSSAHTDEHIDATIAAAKESFSAL